MLTDISQELIQKAATYFRAGRGRDEVLALVFQAGGEQLEVTDDVLKRLPGVRT